MRFTCKDAGHVLYIFLQIQIVHQTQDVQYTANGRNFIYTHTKQRHTHTHIHKTAKKERIIKSQEGKKTAAYYGLIC